MCGICGIVSFSGRRIAPSVVEAMNATLVHRGPDSAGTFVEGSVGLAARRLAIIDIAGGDQPLSNEDGSVTVVQNGEIYNHRELRTQLERAGHLFRTRSDTEVLAHLYEEEGLDFAGGLRGMFAVALWDDRRRRLVLARDAFGIKPLYYSVKQGELLFASELKALVATPGFSREIDLSALEAYLDSNAVPAPLTIFRDARKLPAGHLLVWDQGDPEPTMICYARPKPDALEDLVEGDEDKLAELLRERLLDSVQAHLISDVPVGVLLSGGVDSSAITALAASASSQPIRTFSIGFDEQGFNELEKARMIAELYGTDHHELVVRPNAVELLPEIATAFDEPFADNSALPTYLVSKLASQHVKVVLSGEGGDELFGGYYTYVADLLAPRVGRMVSLARPLIERLPSSSGSLSREFMAKRFARSAHLPALERHHGWKVIFTPDARAELLQPAQRGRLDPLDLYRNRYSETEGADHLARLMDVDVGIYLVDDLLVKVDRASMAHSLETRVPFLDPVVSQFAFSLPSRFKVRGFAKKRLLRKAVAPLLPDSLLAARKQGFSVPAAAWFRGDLRSFVAEALSPTVIRRQAFFRPEYVTGLIGDHVSGRRDMSRELWNLMMFSLWYDRYAT